MCNKGLFLSKKKFQCKILGENHCINQTLRGKKKKNQAKIICRISYFTLVFATSNF